MSLETVIQENTDTMKKLIAAWNALTINAKSAQADVATGEHTVIKAGGVPVVEVSAPKPAPTPTAPETATPAPTEAAAPTPATASPSEPALTYDQVAKVILAHIQAKGKPAAMALLDGFKLKSLTAAKPEQFAAIKAKFEAELA